MDKAITAIKNLGSYIMNPSFLKMAIIVVFGLLFIYNALILTKYLFKKFKKKKEKKEIDLEPETIVERIIHFFKNNSLRVLEASIVSNLILFFFFTTALASYAIPLPKVVYPLDPSLGVTEITDEKPVEIKFDRPISRGSLEYSITPEIKGEWKFDNYSTSLKFYPLEAPKSGERYTVSLKNIKSIMGRKKENYLFSLQIPPPPKILSVTPEKGDTGVLPGQIITIKTDNPHKNTAVFTFEMEPKIEFDIKNEETKYILKPKEKLKKGTSYNLKIYRTLTTFNYETKEKKPQGEKSELWDGTFTTIEAPGVDAYSPSGSGIFASTPIILEFKQDMEPVSTEKAISIAPSVQGAFSWEGLRKLIFTPSRELAKNTTYTIKVSTEAKAADESPFEEEFSYTFTTIGYVQVSSFSPIGNNVGTTSQIKMTFNQAVDHGSAQSKFSISPNVAGAFTWSGNTMIYTQNGFSYNASYAVSIASGVKTVNGLDSNKVHSYRFTTRDQSTTLSVPSYPQSHMYSCMASAARQALAYRGVYVSENTILAQIGYDNTPFQGAWGDPSAIWGDPEVGVTGNIDGASGGISWGYGAHAGPTSRAISNYRANEIKSGWTVQGIAQEIANGNPVIVWWVNGVWPAYTVNWKTPGGRTVSGVNSMHVQVVKGFTGTIDNPTSFTVNDSGYGYPATTYDVGTFAAKWSWFGNTGIIVR